MPPSDSVPVPTDPSGRPILGYCTNVHPGVDVAAIVQNLESISASVRQRLLPPRANEGTTTVRRRDTGPMLPVGLWLPAVACTQLRRDGVAPLLQSLKKNRLMAYTINGFPYDNFHGARVKHEVYRPQWWCDERLFYTRDLAKILVELLPTDVNLGSISTLPIGWPPQNVPGQRSTQENESEFGDQLHHAGTNLRRLAEDLRRLEERTGKRIVVGIEPEPGCILSTTKDVVSWFEDQLPEPTHRRYIGVCHDICHAAVMGERQSDVLKKYADAGILLTKIQISSAIVADWQTIQPTDHAEALDQMSAFAEDRYLHQTGRMDRSGKFTLCEDLPELIASQRKSNNQLVSDQRWITHFHIPLFASHFGHLTTTQNAVAETIHAVESMRATSGSRRGKNTGLQFTGHYEIETYAWSVLPQSTQRTDLVEDIAQEFRWVQSQFPELVPSPVSNMPE